MVEQTRFSDEFESLLADIHRTSFLVGRQEALQKINVLLSSDYSYSSEEKEYLLQIKGLYEDVLNPIYEPTGQIVEEKIVPLYLKGYDSLWSGNYDQSLRYFIKYCQYCQIGTLNLHNALTCIIEVATRMDETLIARCACLLLFNNLEFIKSIENYSNITSFSDEDLDFPLHAAMHNISKQQDNQSDIDCWVKILEAGIGEKSISEKLRQKVTHELIQYYTRVNDSNSINRLLDTPDNKTLII